MSAKSMDPPASVVTVRAADGLVVVAGRVCAMSHQEIRLLSALLEREGRPVARADLARRAWGLTLPPADRRVDVCVHRLRRKLRRVAPGWEFVHTHPRLGYRFEPEPLAHVPGNGRDPSETRIKELV